MKILYFNTFDTKFRPTMDYLDPDCTNIAIIACGGGRYAKIAYTIPWEESELIPPKQAS